MVVGLSGCQCRRCRPWWSMPIGPRGPARRRVLSFFSGWLTGELPIHNIVWQALATVVFGLLGAFGSWPGWVGLGDHARLRGSGWSACTESSPAVVEQALDRPGV